MIFQTPKGPLLSRDAIHHCMQHETAHRSAFPPGGIPNASRFVFAAPE
jgi:hypothetical protein